MTAARTASQLVMVSTNLMLKKSFFKENLLIIVRRIAKRTANPTAAHAEAPAGLSAAMVQHHHQKPVVKALHAAYPQPRKRVMWTH